MGKKKIKTILLEESIKKYVILSLFVMIIVLFSEVIIFNFRHWQSLGNNPINAVYFGSDNISFEDYNTFRVDSLNQTPYIEIDNVDEVIDNIEMDYIFPDKGEYGVRVLEYHLDVIDEGITSWYSNPKMEFLRLAPQSHYVYTNFYGKTKNLRICFDNLNEGDSVKICSLTINSVVQMMISKKRMIVLFLVIMLLILIRPGSFLYNYKASEKSGVRTAGIIAVLFVEILFTWWGMNLNAAFQNPQDPSECQFMLLAEALASGQTHLLIEPPQELISLEDPYDTEARLRACPENELLWDTAYYDGHYYVYFGVAPILLFYLPYFLLTGQHIRTVVVVFICSVFLLAGIPFLICEIIKRWFDKTSLPIFIMLTVMVSFGCGLTPLMMKADFYAVPLAMAMALVVWGGYFWLHSVNEDTVRPAYVMVGSFLMALEAATRPQFLLASFIALLIFWDAVFKKRLLFSRKGLKSTIAFCTPYVLVAAGVMFYNYVRFGSGFDFGANYNLTYNNMPYRGFRLDRTFYATVGYLFMPCTVSNYFPYFDLASYFPRYQGWCTDEKIMGGIIYNNLYLIPTLFPWIFRKYIKNTKLRIFTYVAPIMALVVSVVDTNMAGALNRYICDFSFYFLLSGVVIICSLFHYIREQVDTATVSGQTTEKSIYEKLLKIVTYLIIVCFVIVLVRVFLSLFAGESNPKLNLMLTWHKVAHLVEFWR